MIEKEFLENYRNIVLDDFDEDFKMFRSVKRTVNSYIKNPNVDKLHSIYNRIFILKRLFFEDFLYEKLRDHMDSIFAKNLIIYFVNEAFNKKINVNEEIIEDLWAIQIQDLLENYKIAIEG